MTIRSRVETALAFVGWRHTATLAHDRHVWSSPYAAGQHYYVGPRGSVRFGRTLATSQPISGHALGRIVERAEALAQGSTREPA